LALETAGVEFIDENGGEPGLRLRKATEEMMKLPTLFREVLVGAI